MISQEFDERVTEAAMEVELVSLGGINAITETKIGQEILSDFGNAIAISFLAHLGAGMSPEEATQHALRETTGHVVTVVFDMGRIFQSHGWLPEMRQS